MLSAASPSRGLSVPSPTRPASAAPRSSGRKSRRLSKRLQLEQKEEQAAPRVFAGWQELQLTVLEELGLDPESSLDWSDDGVPDFNARLFCEEIWWSLSSSSNGASGRGSSGSSSSTAFKAPEAGVINVAFVTPAGSPAAPLPLAPPAALSGLLPIIGRVFPTLADVQIAASLAAAHAAAAEDAAEAVGEAAAAEAGAADEAAAEEAAARILIPGSPEDMISVLAPSLCTSTWLADGGLVATSKSEVDLTAGSAALSGADRILAVALAPKYADAAPADQVELLASSCIAAAAADTAAAVAAAEQLAISKGLTLERYKLKTNPGPRIASISVKCAGLAASVNKSFAQLDGMQITVNTHEQGKGLISVQMVQREEVAGSHQQVQQLQQVKRTVFVWLVACMKVLLP